ncbi:thyrotropin-releasing hormone receptor-like, partial [Hetaerina americana]|uniref:thyrotropin-releasing hormone receptor-like n=1 Tax=Hetaerina americana TaxID=62018 RepID=UPI003A7F36F8
MNFTPYDASAGYGSPAVVSEDGFSATGVPRLSDGLFMIHDPAAAAMDFVTPGPDIDAGNYTGISVEELPRDPEYYSHRYRLIGTLFQGVILAVGVAGNALVVAVVARSRSMRSPTNCYLVSLAIADSIVLIASVPNEILSYFLIGNRWVWGEPGCALFIFSQNLGINASSLSLVALTVERYVGICHPMRAQAMCTVSRAKKITLGVWAFATLYCSPWLGLTETKPLKYRGHPEVSYCDFKRPRQEYLAYFFADLVVFYVIPLLISCVLYILIARVLFARRRLFRQTRSEAAAAAAAVASTNGASTSSGLQASPAASTHVPTNFKSPPLHIESTANANHARAQ